MPIFRVLVLPRPLAAVCLTLGTWTPKAWMRICGQDEACASMYECWGVICDWYLGRLHVPRSTLICCVCMRLAFSFSSMHRFLFMCQLAHVSRQPNRNAQGSGGFLIRPMGKSKGLFAGANKVRRIAQADVARGESRERWQLPYLVYGADGVCVSGPRSRMNQACTGACLREHLLKSDIRHVSARPRPTTQINGPIATKPIQCISYEYNYS
ncbi:hypothetical protein V8C42DRAFT_324755 [Trichoderma barbatum]